MNIEIALKKTCIDIMFQNQKRPITIIPKTNDEIESQSSRQIGIP